MSLRGRWSLGTLIVSILVLALPAALSAQAGSVTGKVVHETTGTGIPAVQVSIPALKVSALTAADGSFTLNGVAPGNHQLRVIRIGYRAATVPVEVRPGDNAIADIRIAEVAMALDEIVVTGTVGAARKREVGNSIAQVNVTDVKQPVQNLDQMLQGREAGIVIPTGGADMGSGQPIRLRGNASLSLVSYPLIYVDGIRQSGEGYAETYNGGQASMLSDIDPATIERVEIVKGPAATAMYGTEAAAGVIQIFTKRGTPGRTTWTFQTDQGVRFERPWGSQPGTYVGTSAIPAGSPTQPCISMADQATIDRGAASIGTYLDTPPTNLVLSGCHRPYHDLDPYLQKPWRQRYTVSVAGGTDLVRFFTSGSGEGGGGVLPNDTDLRAQFRSNVSFHPSDKLNVDVSSAYTRYRFTNSGYGNAVDGLYFQVVRRPQNGPASYDYAKLDSILLYDINQRNDRMILGATATWTPLKGMTHKFTVGYDDARSEQKYVHPFGYIVDRPGAIGLQNTTSRAFSTDYVLSQQISLLSDLSATLSVGGQLIQRDQSNVNMEGTGLPGPGEHTVASASSLTDLDVTEQRVITGGFLFQNMFAIKDRYFITAGVRVDGNSAFGKDLGLETYPKASLSYVISDESFWPRSLGTLKLRAAYGWAGRAPGAFDATRTWQAQLFQAAGGTALIPDNTGNDSLGPERSKEMELGADASFLNDRLAADFSWYSRTTSDALLNVSLPASLGNTSGQLFNVGKFVNRGIELGITGKVLEGTNFGLDIQATLATNYSKVLEVGPARINNVVVGQPAPVIRATKVLNAYDFADPIFAPDSANFYGPSLPTHTFTFAPTVRLPKNISITARGEYQRGHWVTQGAAHFLAQRGPFGTPSCDDVYRIVPWNEYDGPYPSSVIKTHANLGQVNAVDRARCYRKITQSNLFTWPGSFFKIREITLQAPVPFQLPRLQSATVTLSVRNIFTKLPGKNRSQSPDAGGSVEGLSFNYSDLIPAPAEFTVSFRATF